jgi:anti-anti-sigma factor
MVEDEGGSGELTLHIDRETVLEDQHVTIRLAGELDPQTVPLLLDGFAELDLDGVETLTICCGDLTFLDSSGIQALVELRQATSEAEVAFRMTHVNEAQYRVLEITQLVDLLRASARGEDRSGEGCSARSGAMDSSSETTSGTSPPAPGRP